MERQQYMPWPYRDTEGASYERVSWYVGMLRTLEGTHDEDQRVHSVDGVGGKFLAVY